jgi:hypothetical protein
VTSLFVVVALLVGKGLGSIRMRVVEQNERNSYECDSCHSKVVVYAHYIQLALLLLWLLVLQTPSFAVGRVGIDEIKKGKLGEVKG